MLLDTINNLRSREAELSANEKGINSRLDEINIQKSKLADDWVIRNMDGAKFKELQQNLEKEEARLRAILAKIDPAHLKELEHTRDILQYWETQLRSMAWNTEDEVEGHMVRTVDKPHQAVLQVIGLENKDLTKVEGFPASKRELLDKFQVKLVVYPDRLDVKSGFDIEPINYQNVTSTREGAGNRLKKPIIYMISVLKMDCSLAAPTPIRLTGQLISSSTLSIYDLAFCGKSS